MRVNLLFEGLGVTFQKFEETNHSTNENPQNTPTLRATRSREKRSTQLRNILVIEG